MPTVPEEPPAHILELIKARIADAQLPCLTPPGADLDIEAKRVGKLGFGRAGVGVLRPSRFGFGGRTILRQGLDLP